MNQNIDPKIRMADIGSQLSFVKFKPTNEKKIGLELDMIHKYNESIEGLYSGRFSTEYQGFLQFFNGGYSERFSSFVTDTGINGRNYEIYERFFGYYEEEEFKEYDIRHVIEKSRSYVPQDMLPIASILKADVSEKVLCLGPQGSIYLCKNDRKRTLEIIFPLPGLRDKSTHLRQVHGIVQRQLCPLLIPAQGADTDWSVISDLLYVFRHVHLCRRTPTGIEYRPL